MISTAYAKNLSDCRISFQIGEQDARISAASEDVGSSSEALVSSNSARYNFCLLALPQHDLA
jgi:hypothetical protein